MIKNAFPSELKKALSCISDETRQLIITKLLVGECSYTDIKQGITTSRGNLNHHLDELQKAGIVMKYSKHKIGSPYDSYYSIGIFGRDLIKGMFMAIQPSKPIVQDSLSALTAAPSLSPAHGVLTSSLLRGIDEQLKSLSLTSSGKIKVEI